MALLLATGSLAGCSTVTTYEFRADLVALPPDARAALGYREVYDRPQTVSYDDTVHDKTVTATVENHVVAYETTGSHPTETLDDLSVGAMSTPPATVLDTALNPAATLSMRELLTGDGADRLLALVGVDDGGWRDPPEEVGSSAVTLVGDRTVLESFAGRRTGADRPDDRVLFAHLARATSDDDVVLLAAVHDHAADARASEYVGDDGVVTDAEFDAVTAEVGRVGERLELGCCE